MVISNSKMVFVRSGMKTLISWGVMGFDVFTWVSKHYGGGLGVLHIWFNAAFLLRGEGGRGKCIKSVAYLAQ